MSAKPPIEDVHASLAHAGSTRARRALNWTCVLAVGAALAASCARHPATASQPVAAVDIVLKTPPDTARTLLLLLRAQLHASAGRDRAALHRAQEQTADQVLARDEILARYHTLAGRAALEDSRALDNLVENWAAIVAFYADGFEFERMRQVSPPNEGLTAVVDVPARGPHDQTILRIGCLRGKDEQWRVTSLAFATAEPATPLASQPVPTTSAAATQP